MEFIKRYYSFNDYLREKFGERVHRISIDAGFSCPNLDGSLSKDGCIYCNNKAFSMHLRRNSDDNLYNETGRIEGIKEQIKSSIKFYKGKYKIKKFVAYFQSFSNTYADINTLKKTYDVIKEFPEFVGLFISTRPDCVDEEKLDLIESYKKYDNIKTVWIEYGLQTTDNKILKSINRGHTYEDFLEALKLTKRCNIKVGVHLILGLPGQCYKDIMSDAVKIAKLPIDGIKFHVLHILRNTLLEKIYYEKKIKIFSDKEYVSTVCDFIERIPKNFVILRLISNSKKEYLISPQWINKKNEIITEIKQELERRDTFQGKFLSKD